MPGTSGPIVMEHGPISSSLRAEADGEQSPAVTSQGFPAEHTTFGQGNLVKVSQSPDNLHKTTTSATTSALTNQGLEELGCPCMLIPWDVCFSFRLHVL